MNTLDKHFDASPKPPSWRELSDDDLLKVDFEVSDPESLDRLSTVEVDEDGPEIEMAYDMRRRGQKVECVYCKYPNHFVGIVVVYPSGARTLVGRDCAVKHHEADFKLLLKDFDAARDRQDYVRRARKLMAYRASILEGMQALRGHPAVAPFDQLRGKMRFYLENTWNALAQAAHGDGMLRIERRIRDHAAEERRDQRLGLTNKVERREAKKRGERDPIYMTVYDDVGRLEGVDFFRNGTNVSTRLEEIANELTTTIWKLGEKELRVSEIRAGIFKLGDLRDRIEREHERLEAFASATTDQNLALIADWGNRRAPPDAEHRLHSGHRVLRVERIGWNSFTDLDVPSVYFPPRRELIARIKEASAIDAPS